MQIAKDQHPFYNIPRGGIGIHFLEIKTALFKGMRKCHYNLRKPLIFTACILTQEWEVVFAPNIRKLTTIWFDMREQGQICALVSVVEVEAKGGLGKRPNAIGNEDFFE